MLLDKRLSAGKCSVAYKATPLAGLAWLDEARRGDSVQKPGNFAQETGKTGVVLLTVCCNLLQTEVENPLYEWTFTAHRFKILILWNTRNSLLGRRTT